MKYESLEHKFRERERFLLIYAYQIQNVDKMIDLLKTVSSNFITRLASETTGAEVSSSFLPNIILKNSV